MNKILYTLAICSIAFYLPKVKLQQTSIFYEFAPGPFGAIPAPKNDDGSFGPIKLGVGIPFFNNVYPNLFINTNGVLSFLFPITSPSPIAFPMLAPLIAVFWTDLNPLVRGQILYRESSSTSDLNQAKGDVLKASPSLVSFSPTRVYIVTWQEVSAYGGSFSAANTFQAAIATNGTVSYLIFNYGSLSLISKSIQIGGNSGDGVNFYKFPENLIANISSLSTLSNINVPGKWVFRIDSLSNSSIQQNKQVNQNFSIEGTLVRNLIGHTAYVNQVALLSNGNLASGGGDRTLRIWDPSSGVIIRNISTSNRNIYSIQPLSNGDLACGLSDSTIRVFNPSTGAEIYAILTGYDAVRLVLLSNGNLASGGWTKKIQIWDQFTGKLVRNLTGHTENIFGIALLSNGNLASGSLDKTIRVWNPNTGELIINISTGQPVRQLALLSNGNLASVSDDMKIRIWNLYTAALIVVLTGHDSWIPGLVPLPDGKLASGSMDQTIRVWDLSTGQSIKTISTNGQQVWTLVLLSNNNLASSGFSQYTPSDGGIRIWR